MKSSEYFFPSSSDHPQQITGFKSEYTFVSTTLSQLLLLKVAHTPPRSAASNGVGKKKQAEYDE